MSYDLHIWASRFVDLIQGLPNPAQWESEHGRCVLRGRTWQVAIGPCDNAEPEDIPHEIKNALPGIQHLIVVNIEPTGAPKEAYMLAHQATKTLAKLGHGVIFDPQADTVQTPSRVKRFIAASESERVALVSISWWFDGGKFRTHQAMERLISCIANELPEALPQRYGLYEPPQFRFAETGHEHFVEFLTANEMVVWYPSRPVADVSMSLPPVWGASARGFRSNRLSVDIEQTALNQPGWQHALRQFWISISRIVRPFYGDVRTLRNYHRRGGRLVIGRDTEHHPVSSWWWRGLPSSGGHAVVLGEPYLPLWPAFKKVSTIFDELAFLDSGDWTTHGDIFQKTGGAPKAAVMKQPSFERILQEPKYTYPKLWPFEKPYRETD